jgi:FtsP/CotA-like multicopper oxidase with cupredoxin domain
MSNTSPCIVEELQSPVEFSSHMPHEGSPPTLFNQRPDISFTRNFYNDTLRFPDGLEMEIWSFEPDGGPRTFPAPLTRVREGQLVHVTLHPQKRVHTIHHHGIEPDPRNDGVGHTSFEVSGSYTYQWRPEVGVPGDPNRGAAGSYFYHCHVNTTLHVQMGMFGPIVVDPVVGPGKAFVDGPEYDVTTETYWVVYAADPRWHTLDHAAGLDGKDVGLNRFNPTNLYFLGGNLHTPGRGPVLADTGVTAHLGGPPTLIRVLNSTYFPMLLDFGSLEVEVIAHDGRPFRDTTRTPSPPVSCRTSKLIFGAAERYDLLVRPTRRGTFPVEARLLDWITLATRLQTTETVTVV